METRPIRLTEVMYNAASQCFEATVTVYDDLSTRKYACAIQAPITLSFEDAARGLATQAKRQHASQSGLYAEVRSHMPAHRAARRGFDPKRWLQGLIQTPERHAA